MKSKHVFISIDGVDGVGKTTVAKLFATDCGYHYHKSPSGMFAQLRSEVDLHATPLERYCFYRLASQHDSAQISQLLQTTSVICDRYIASTAAYHFAMDPRIREIHEESTLLIPHFAFLLEARSDVRKDRMAKRATITSDATLERNGAFLDQVNEVFRTLGLISVDTSDVTVEEVVATVRNIVEGKGGV
ncbi:MAG: hypothetical protein WC870_00640 [Candidatus Paceibacterota bacterium]